MAKKRKNLSFMTRTADGAAELLTGVVGMAGVVPPMPFGMLLIGVQSGVAEEAEGGTVELVGAALGDDVDGGAFRAAVLSREALGADVKLLHGFKGKLHHRSADSVVFVVDAVDGDVDVASAVAVHGQDRVAVLGGIVGVGRP